MKRTKHFAVLSYILMTAFSQVSGQKLYAVGQRTFFYDDKSRSRRLTTELWYPTTAKASMDENSPFVRLPTAKNASIAQGKFPLILFSHGTGGGRLTVEWFCAGLASNGFIVAAVDHFGNTFDNPIPIEFVKFWERPQDVRYVLDQLLKIPDITASIDTDKIGAAGFSLGGYTAIALGGGKMDLKALTTYFQTEQGKQEADIPEMPGLISFFDKPEVQESFNKAPLLKDGRIKSLFVMSPAIGQGFPEKENLKDVTIPVFIVVAANDHIAPANTNAAHYATRLGQSRLKSLGDGAGHYVFLNEANEGLKNEAPLFFKDPKGVDRTAIHEQTLQLAVEHFRKTMK